MILEYKPARNTQESLLPVHKQKYKVSMSIDPTLTRNLLKTIKEYLRRSRSAESPASRRSWRAIARDATPRSVPTQRQHL
jgi:hypothetical protein